MVGWTGLVEGYTLHTPGTFLDTAVYSSLPYHYLDGIPAGALNFCSSVVIGVQTAGIQFLLWFCSMLACVVLGY